METRCNGRLLMDLTGSLAQLGNGKFGHSGLACVEELCLTFPGDKALSRGLA